MNAIPLLKVFVSPDVDKPLLDVLHSGYIGEGPKVKAFEAALMDKFQFPHVLTVNSCTSALQLALRLAGVGQGDFVLSTPATNMATNSMILAMGATPYWVDIDPRTGRVDPTKLPAKVPKNTKALMIMDWGGVPCDYGALLAYTKAHGIYLIEDAAHALGAMSDGKYVGSFADFTCFSFQAVKHLTTGDGGALVCKTYEAHERGRLLRWFGIDRENPTKQADLRCEAPIREFGYKMHMNDIAATIGLANLERFDFVVKTARENAAFYTDKIVTEMGAKTEEGNPGNWVEEMKAPLNVTPTYWLYSLSIQKDRDRFADALRSMGVACSKVHSRNDEHPCMPKASYPLPGVDRFYETTLSIPVGWWVTKMEREHILDCLKKAAALVWSKSKGPVA